MKIKVVGIKRSEGIVEETKQPYKGFKLYCTYPALESDVIGEQVGEKFFSDKLLGGVVPQIGDEFEVINDPFDGRIKAVNPIVKFKDAPHAVTHNNYNAPKPEGKDNGNGNAAK